MADRNVQKGKLQKGLGFSDFGTGVPVIMSSMCLRNAELPGSCIRCIKRCPVTALRIDASGKIVQDETCVRCGICMEICPVAAISMTRVTIQELNRRNLDASLKTARLVLTCERTKALARVEAESARDAGADGGSSGDTGGSANKGKDSNNLHEILDAAAKDDILQYVPCFGMMGSEIWFSLLNEIDQYVLKQVDMLLPSGQCTECPANKDGIAERCFEHALSVVEQWTNQPVGLLFDGADLLKSSSSLLTPLKEFASGDHEVARREMFSEAFKSLRTTWTTAVEAAEAAKTPAVTAQQEAAIKRNRREAYQKTVLGQQKPVGRTAQAQSETRSQPDVLPRSIKKPPPTTKEPRIVPKRYLLIEALGRNPLHASRVELTVSKTKKRCNGCGRCIKACPLQARALNAERKAEVNTAVCLGCKRCKKVCSKKAIEMTTISGSEFLL